MAHPFFDATKYPASRADAIDLRKLLIKYYDTYDSLLQLYEEAGGERGELPVQGTPQTLWGEALRNLTKNPPALKNLCQFVKTQFPNTPEVQSVITAVENAVPASAVRIISSSVLMLDRASLRDCIEEISSNANPAKIVIVRGDSKSGKSHGRFLFEFIAREQEAIAVYLREGLISTVDEAILQLFAALNATDKVPPKASTEDAWYKTVCLELQVQANKLGQVIWIAIDDLGVDAQGSPLMDTQIRKFFDQFALSMVNPAFKNCFRLMLIHYPEGPVPSKWMNDIYIENETREADIQQADVEALLQDWAAAGNRKFVKPEEIPNLAADVIAKADAPPEQGKPRIPRLKLIHDLLKSTIKKLEARIP